MASNFPIDDAAIKAFEAIKLQHNAHYIIYKVGPLPNVVPASTGIVIEESLPSSEPFEYKEFRNKLTEKKEPRYAVLDYHHTYDDGRKVEKLIFIFYCPDNSGVKVKMTYSSGKENFSKKLLGIAKSYQANDIGDLEEKNIIAPDRKSVV